MYSGVSGFCSARFLKDGCLRGRWTTGRPLSPAHWSSRPLDPVSVPLCLCYEPFSLDAVIAAVLPSRSRLHRRPLFVASLWPLCGIASRPGNAILREIVVQHPAAKSMLEIARTQDEETGDGASMARPPPTLNPARPRPRPPCHQPRRTSRPCCAALAAQVADGTAPRHRPRQH